MRAKLMKVFGGLGFLLILATTGYLAWNGKYLEALAFWGVCSVFLWFLLRAGERRTRE